MNENEFLPQQQCFIVYEESNKSIAMSIRDRLSAKNIKCSAWDEKHFRDNEARMTNYNRVFILSEKCSKEYLRNPEISCKVADYVYYQREGRVAGIVLDSKIDFNNVKSRISQTTKILKKSIKVAPTEQQQFLKTNIPVDVARSFLSGNSSLPVKNEDEYKFIERLKETAKDVTALGSLVGATVSSIAAPVGFAIVCASLLYGTVTNKKTCKYILTLAGAIEFINNYIDDFVKAQ